MRTRIALVSAAAAIVGIGVVYLHGAPTWPLDSAPAGERTGDPKLASPIDAAEGGAVRQAMVPASAAVLPSPAPADLLMQLNASQNLRQYAQQARQHPELGGIFYADVAERRCMNTKDAIAQRHTEAASPSYEGEAALRQLEALCGTYLETEVSPTRRLESRSVDAAKRDPLLAMQKQLLDASTSEQRKEAVAAILHARNPYILASGGVGMTDKGLYFAGEYYGSDHTKHQMVYFSALRLAGCDLGDRCDGGDFSVMHACAFTSHCVRDRFELVAIELKELGLGSAAGDEAKELARRMVAAVNAGNVSAFVP